MQIVTYSYLHFEFLDPKCGSQNATLVVVVVVVVSSVKMPEAFLTRCTTKLCIHARVDVAHRSTVSDFPLIFSLMSNYQSSFKT